MPFALSTGVVLSSTLVELTDVAMASMTCTSGAEGGVRLAKSLLLQAINISSAIPRMELV
jgi:hypothetical protein